MQLENSLTASTCATYGATFITANDKHYRVVKELDVSVFRPNDAQRDRYIKINI